MRQSRRPARRRACMHQRGGSARENGCLVKGPPLLTSRHLLDAMVAGPIKHEGVSTLGLDGGILVAIRPARTLPDHDFGRPRAAYCEQRAQSERVRRDKLACMQGWMAQQRKKPQSRAPDLQLPAAPAAGGTSSGPWMQPLSMQLSGSSRSPAASVWL